MKKRVKTISVALAVALIMWVLASWIDVVSHNMHHEPVSCWNLFKLSVEGNDGTDGT